MYYIVLSTRVTYFGPCMKLLVTWLKRRGEGRGYAFPVDLGNAPPGWQRPARYALRLLPPRNADPGSRRKSPGIAAVTTTPSILLHGKIILIESPVSAGWGWAQRRYVRQKIATKPSKNNNVSSAPSLETSRTQNSALARGNTAEPTT